MDGKNDNPHPTQLQTTPPETTTIWNGFTCSTGWESISGWNKCSGNKLDGLDPRTVDVSATGNPLERCKDECNNDLGCQAVTFEETTNTCKKYNNTKRIPFTFASNDYFTQAMVGKRNCLTEYSKEECLSLPGSTEKNDLALPLGCLRKDNEFLWNNETTEYTNVSFSAESNICVSDTKILEINEHSSCTSANRLALSETECQEAAGTNDFATVEDANLPPSCSISGTSVYYNTHTEATGVCTNTTCVCKRKPAPYILSSSECDSVDGFSSLDSEECQTAGNWLKSNTVTKSTGHAVVTTAVNVQNSPTGTKCILTGQTVKYDHPYTVQENKGGSGEYECDQHNTLPALKEACNADDNCTGVSLKQPNCSQKLDTTAADTDKCREVRCETRVNQWGQCMDASKECTNTHNGASNCSSGVPSACKPNHKQLGNVNTCRRQPNTEARDSSKFAAGVYHSNQCADPDNSGTPWCYNATSDEVLTVRKVGTCNSWGSCSGTCSSLGAEGTLTRAQCEAHPKWNGVYGGTKYGHASNRTDGWNRSSVPYGCITYHPYCSNDGGTGDQKNKCVWWNESSTGHDCSQNGLDCVCEDGFGPERNYCNNAGDTTTKSGQVCQRWDCRETDNSNCTLCQAGHAKIWNGDCVPTEQKTCMDTNHGAATCSETNNVWQPETCRVNHRPRSYNNYANSNCTICLDGYVKNTHDGTCIKEDTNPDTTNYPIWSYFNTSFTDSEGPWICTSGATCMDTTKTPHCLLNESTLSEDAQETVHVKPTSVQTCNNTNNCVCKWEAPSTSKNKGRKTLAECQSLCNDDPDCNVFSVASNECLLHTCDKTESDHLWDGVWKRKTYDTNTNTELDCGTGGGNCICKDAARLIPESNTVVFIKNPPSSSV